jgi:hypothetical protein
MKRPTDNERLFADALAEAGPADFRASLLGETLRLARRRRRVRQVRSGAMMLGIVAALALWFWPRTVVHPPKTEPVVASYRLIETQPLPANEIVTTQPFTSSIIASAPTANVITTAEAHDGLRLLTDDELLSMAPAHAMLVRLGPHSAELILANQSQAGARE